MQLDFEPTAVVLASDSKMYILDKDSVRSCDNLGNCSGRMSLPFKSAAGMTIGPANKPIVVSSDGKVALCDQQCAIQ